LSFFEVAKKCEIEAYKLGATPSVFWEMIPAEFFCWQRARIDALKIDIKNKQHLTGLICATIANFAPSKKRKVYKIEDFIAKERKKKTGKEMLKTVERLNKLFGGKDTRG